MKAKETIELIEKDGWYLARTRGSHRQDKHQTKIGLVTVFHLEGLKLEGYEIPEPKTTSTYIEALV